MQAKQDPLPDDTGFSKSAKGLLFRVKWKTAEGFLSTGVVLFEFCFKIHLVGLAGIEALGQK